MTFYENYIAVNVFDLLFDKILIYYLKFNQIGRVGMSFILTINDERSKTNSAIIKDPTSTDIKKAIQVLKQSFENFIILESTPPVDTFTFIQATDFNNGLFHVEAQYEENDDLYTYYCDTQSENDLLAMLLNFRSNIAPNIDDWDYLGNFRKSKEDELQTALKDNETEVLMSNNIQESNARLKAADNTAKIKTVNFGVVFAIGAIAVFLMGRSIIRDDLQTPWPLYLGVSLFGLVALVGMIGIIVLLRKHLILKSVLKHGTKTVGKYKGVGRIIQWSNNRRYGSGIKSTWYNQIIFSYTADGVEREYKSCTVYLDNQVKKLEKLKTFSVKYKGKHAIICEKI